MISQACHHHDSNQAHHPAPSVPPEWGASHRRRSRQQDWQEKKGQLSVCRRWVFKLWHLSDLEFRRVDFLHEIKNGKICTSDQLRWSLGIAVTTEKPIQALVYQVKKLDRGDNSFKKKLSWGLRELKFLDAKDASKVSNTKHRWIPSRGVDNREHTSRNFVSTSVTSNPSSVCGSPIREFSSPGRRP